MLVWDVKIIMLAATITGFPPSKRLASLLIVLLFAILGAGLASCRVGRYYIGTDEIF